MPCAKFFLGAEESPGDRLRATCDVEKERRLTRASERRATSRRRDEHAVPHLHGCRTRVGLHRDEGTTNVRRSLTSGPSAYPDFYASPSRYAALGPLIFKAFRVADEAGWFRLRAPFHVPVHCTAPRRYAGHDASNIVSTSMNAHRMRVTTNRFMDREAFVRMHMLSCKSIRNGSVIGFGIGKGPRPALQVFFLQNAALIVNYLFRADYSADVRVSVPRK